MNSYEPSGSDAVIEYPRHFPVTRAMPDGKSKANAPSKFDSIYVVDWLAALILFAISLPVLLLSALWVAILDQGNPIFTQVRVGRNGRPFKIFKIRTMRHDHEGVTRFCAQGDDRVLPGGHFLRRKRIDELPQFLNVLLGDMALVGPRPEQAGFVAMFRKAIPHYEERFKVKPGITGLAQITQGYVDSLRGTKLKLKFDLIFIKKRSLGFWFYIVTNTVKVVIFGHGAR